MSMLEAWLAGEVPHDVMADWCEERGVVFPRSRDDLDLVALIAPAQHEPLWLACAVCALESLGGPIEWGRYEDVGLALRWLVDKGRRPLWSEVTRWEWVAEQNDGLPKSNALPPVPYQSLPACGTSACFTDFPLAVLSAAAALMVRVPCTVCEGLGYVPDPLDTDYVDDCGWCLHGQMTWVDSQRVGTIG